MINEKAFPSLKFIIATFIKDFHCHDIKMNTPKFFALLPEELTDYKKHDSLIFSRLSNRRP